MQSRRRLTLLELTAVFAVCVLFVGMMLPVLGSMREKHHRAICLNNVKQIGLSLRLYSGDCSEKFPADLRQTTLGSFSLLAKGHPTVPPREWIGPSQPNQWWSGPYQSDYQTWICPADIGVVAGSSNKPFTSAHLSYAYGGLGLSESVQPDTPIVCDRSSQGDPTGTNPWNENQWTHKSDGGNVLFADGHVEFLQTMVAPMYRAKNP